QEYKTPTPDARQAGVRSPAALAHTGDLVHGAEAVAIAEIDESDTPFIPSGIGEFDRILGGGIVPGSAVLVGGEPGIGKSTLLLQVAHDVAAGTGVESADSNGGSKVLYVTSEESARQTKLRAGRLGVTSPNLLVLAET